jgi:CRP-like cAMP-binding protein
MLELRIEHLLTMNAAQRIGCLFIKLSETTAQKGPVSFTLPFNKILLANYLGMQRETFSRGLKELTTMGVKIKGNSIYVKEIQSLIQFSCVSCSLYNQ